MLENWAFQGHQHTFYGCFSAHDHTTGSVYIGIQERLTFPPSSSCQRRSSITQELRNIQAADFYYFLLLVLCTGKTCNDCWSSRVFMMRNWLSRCSTNTVKKLLLVKKLVLFSSSSCLMQYQHVSTWLLECGDVMCVCTHISLYVRLAWVKPMGVSNSSACAFPQLIMTFLYLDQLLSWFDNPCHQTIH